MKAPGPAGDRQEHLDEIVSFEGAGQRRRLFSSLDILTTKWATGDLPEECRFLLKCTTDVPEEMELPDVEAVRR